MPIAGATTRNILLYQTYVYEYLMCQPLCKTLYIVGISGVRGMRIYIYIYIAESTPTRTARAVLCCSSSSSSRSNSTLHGIIYNIVINHITPHATLAQPFSPRLGPLSDCPVFFLAPAVPPHASRRKLIKNKFYAKPMATYDGLTSRYTGTLYASRILQRVKRILFRTRETVVFLS